MDFDDLITELAPPPNRVGKCEGGSELHFSEGAVMMAFAMHLLRTTAAREILVHPDGEHGKRFDFEGWLNRRGFDRTTRAGTTCYGGRYALKGGRAIKITPASGRGDVVVESDELAIQAECKGGIINTRRPGQVSRLYKSLCETVGMLMASPSRGRQIAVVPRTEGTIKLAQRLAPRCAVADIEISLMGPRGEVEDVQPR